jgi:hypothetical protein
MSLGSTTFLLFFVALGGLAYFIVPSINTIRARAETTNFVRTVCSSNITDVHYTSTGDYARATVMTVQIGTNHPIRLWFPPIPGHPKYFIGAPEKKDVVAWITRVAAGSPTATFPCLIRDTNTTVLDGITEIWRVPSDAYVLAVVCGCLAILSIVCFILLVRKCMRAASGSEIVYTSIIA